MLRRVLLSLAAALALGAFGQVPHAQSGRYALILKDPPLARQVLVGGVGRSALAGPEARERGTSLLRAQEPVRAALAARNIAVTGAVHTLLNAVFVSAAADRVAELRTLPGVAAVIRLSTA